MIIEIEDVRPARPGRRGLPHRPEVATSRPRPREVLPTTVVVNAAEGEPGHLQGPRLHPRATPTSCSRARSSRPTPWRARRDRGRHEGLVQPTIASGLARGRRRDRGGRLVRRRRRSTVFEGPDEYLFGEETALLEVVDGRPPFPRIAPPYRRGSTRSSSTTTTSTAAAACRARRDGRRRRPRPLGAAGAGRQRRDPRQRARHRRPGRPGSARSAPSALPGTVVCTVTGRHRAARRGRGADGHAARDVIDDVGGGPTPEHAVEGRPERCRRTPCSGRPARHPADLRGPGGGRQRPRLGRLHRVRRRPPT